MLAAPVESVPIGADLDMEPKHDGHRGLLYIENKTAILRSRPGAEISSVPYIGKAVSQRTPNKTVLDGEIVDLTGEGRGRVQSLTKRKAVHVPAPDNPALAYIVFDVICYGGVDLIEHRYTLAERRNVLKKMQLFKLFNSKIIKVIEPIAATPENLQKLLDEGYEGAVVKEKNSYYVPGARNKGWVKCKPDAEIDALCTGTFPSVVGSKYDGRAVGGIKYSVTLPSGAIYEGQCAGKMNDKLREDLYNNPEKYIGLVVELGYWEITKDGALLHPSFRRFRDPDDKEAREL